MEYTKKEIEILRKKLIGYYGSAAPFFGAAMADVIRVEQMSDVEVVSEAINLCL